MFSLACRKSVKRRRSKSENLPGTQKTPKNVAFTLLTLWPVTQQRGLFYKHHHLGETLAQGAFDLTSRKTHLGRGTLAKVDLLGRLSKYIEHKETQKIYTSTSLRIFLNFFQIHHTAASAATRLFSLLHFSPLRLGYTCTKNTETKL